MVYSLHNHNNLYTLLPDLDRFLQMNKYLQKSVSTQQKKNRRHFDKEGEFIWAEGVFFLAHVPKNGMKRKVLEEAAGVELALTAEEVMDAGAYAFEVPPRRRAERNK